MRNTLRKHKSKSTAEKVKTQIEKEGERFWRLSDFEHMPFMAVAKTLSRLSHQGLIQRLGKGLYYRPRQTAFGKSKPNKNHLENMVKEKVVFPAGISAANLLGFTTQNPAKREIATNSLSLPRLLVGKDTIIHTRRPDSWAELSNEDAAILDFLRNQGIHSELSPLETVNKLLKYFKESNRLERLTNIAMSEPPRVRAMIGAIGQQLGCKQQQLDSLRKSLNPFSKFEFGNLALLKYANDWQAKENKSSETF